MGGHIVRGKRARATLPVVLILSVVILAPAAALAKGPPEGKGGPPENELGNNLSVPTIMVGSYSFSVACGSDASNPSALVAPTGTPLTGYDIDGDGVAETYYVQGVHAWQAQCYKAVTASATAAWGDNLGGDASLKVGSPVRVELGLFDDTGVSLLGYTVVKLEPLLDDRYSAYGTLATQECTTNESTGETTCDPWEATAAAFSPVRVYDSAVTLVISRITVVEGGVTEVPIVTEDPVGAEINATGAIVYGYNWRPDAAGEYRISFTTSTKVSITGTDVGVVTLNENGTFTVSLDVTVAGGGGGGGSGYHGH